MAPDLSPQTLSKSECSGIERLAEVGGPRSGARFWV